MQALWRRGPGPTEVGRGDGRAWRWEGPSTGQAPAPGGGGGLRGEQRGWRRWGGMPGRLAGRSPWGGSRGSGGRWWKPSRWRGGPTHEAIARSPENVLRENFDETGGGGVGENIDCNEYATEIRSENVFTLWWLIHLWYKEAVVDDDPDMRNTFSKITADYSPDLGKIFCSQWELLENWL